MKSKLMVALLALGLLLGGGVAPSFAAKTPTTQKTGTGKHKKHRHRHKGKHHRRHKKGNKKAAKKAARKAAKKNKTT